MADEMNGTTSNRPFSIIEEGCLKLNNPDVDRVLYHQSLNVLLGFSSCSREAEPGQQPGVVVLDIASGTLLHDTREPKGPKEDAAPISGGGYKCLSVPERGTLILAKGGLLGVRKDFGRALLLESMLQPCVSSEDATVKLELPHNEAMLLRDCLQSTDMSNAPGQHQLQDGELGQAQVEVINLLTKHMKQYLFSVSKGSRMSSNWCIVSLSLPLKTLRSVCWQAVVELRKSGRSVPALPVAASVVVRLAALLKSGEATLLDAPPPPLPPPASSSNNNSIPWGEPHPHHHHHGNASASPAQLNPMMSEAARRETFAAWPHMDYKWALPGPMAEAGFYHQPNTPESDRAVCFQCFLTLIAWESTDEPWSEHERHAATCPLVKGDYTCNVPLSVTMATQPAVAAHRDGEEVACLSATSCPDLFATGTAGGSVALWNISGPLKKEIAFEAGQAGQLPGRIERLTSLCVLVSRSPSSSSPRCCIVAGLTLEGERAVLAIYDVAWKTALSEPHPVPTGSSSSAVVKKGGTTKKVLPVPHLISASSHSESGGSGGNPGAGLFFSFGDDPLLDEDMAYISAIEAHDKLGKATGLFNKLMQNMGSSTFPSNVQQPAADPSKSSKAPAAAPTTAKSAPTPKPPPDVKLTALLELPEGSRGLDVAQLTPTWDASHLLAVLLPPSRPSAPEGEAPLTGDAAQEARLRSIWEGQQAASSCELLVFKLDDGMLDSGTPAGRLALPGPLDAVRCLVPLPYADFQQHPDPEGDPMEEEADESGPAGCGQQAQQPAGPMRAAVVSDDGRLRLLLMDAAAEEPGGLRMTWLDAEGATSGGHKFVSATYCSSVERICASTDKGELVFFKMVARLPRHLPPLNSVAAAVGQQNQNRSPSSSAKGKSSGQRSASSSTKLLIHQPLTSATVRQLHQLTLAERVPQSFTGLAITAPSCWAEVALTQRQRRHHQPMSCIGSWGQQPPAPATPPPPTSAGAAAAAASSAASGAGAGEDGLYGQMARVYRLQQDKFSWDEHFFEIALPPATSSSSAGAAGSSPATGSSLAHVHLRFVLSPSCTVPPEIQVSLLEQRSRSLQWGRGSSLNLLGSTASSNSEDVDGRINFNVGAGRGDGTPAVLNPVLTPEFLEAHDAALLCGPYKLSQFMSDTGGQQQQQAGQVAVLTLSGHQLLQSTARNFMIHVKYIPAAASSSASSQGQSGKSVSLLNVSRPLMSQQSPSGWMSSGQPSSAASQQQQQQLRRTSQMKGCDWIQEVAVSVQRCKPTSIPQERSQRCALLASSNSTGQLLEFAFKSGSRREHVMVLNILNWKTALHFAAPLPEFRGVLIAAGDVAGHVVEIVNRLKGLIDAFIIRGDRTTAQQAVQLILSTHELAIQCVPEEDVGVMTKQLMFCLLQGLESLHGCASTGVVHWFLVLLSRVYLVSEAEVAGPVWAVLRKIIAELGRRKEPMQELLQCRFGFYGRPFESDGLFNLDRGLSTTSGRAGAGWISKAGSSNIAASFAALHQLVNGMSSSLSAVQSPDGKDKTHGHLEALCLKRSCDLLDVEPLSFTLASASDGVRLERADLTGHSSSQFTAVALNGLVESSKLISSSSPESGMDGSRPTLPTSASHGWHHLLGTSPPLLVVMERLHSGGRKFVVLDFGSPILLTDIHVPACLEWTSIAVDVWSRTDRSRSHDTDLVRLTSSTDINRRPVVLHDLQPPVICRYLRLTVTGRQGLSSSSCRTSAGYYYGHTHLLPNDPLPYPPLAQQPDPLPVLNLEEIREEMATLEVLADHSHCHYVLACDRLRSLVRPLLTNAWTSHDHPEDQDQNGHHIDRYLQAQLSAAAASAAASSGQPSGAQPPCTDEDARIIDAYHECLKLQRQQNLLWGALRRLRRCLAEETRVDHGEEEPAEGEEHGQNGQPAPISQTASHKLHWIAQALVNVLLAATVKKQIRIERKTAGQLFSYLHVTAEPSGQLSVAALLSQSDDTYRWMPQFVADTLKRTLASDASTALIPKDRVFVTLLFMSYKSMQLSSGGGVHHLLDPILAVLDELLSAAFSGDYNPMALAHLDLSLVNWILLFCSCCLDRSYYVAAAAAAASSGGQGASGSAGKDPSRSSQRWDFMQGESLLAKEGPGSGSAESKSGSIGGSAASRIYRRKLQKKLIQSQSHYGAGGSGSSSGMGGSSAGQVFGGGLMGKGSIMAGPGSSAGALSGSNKAKFILAHSKQELHKAPPASSSSSAFEPGSSSVSSRRLASAMDVDVDLDGACEDLHHGRHRSSAAHCGQPICSSSWAARAAKHLVSLLLVVGHPSGSGSGGAFQHQETFLLACKVLARLIGASQNGLRLAQIADENQLTALIRLASGTGDALGTSDGQQWLSHAVYCLLVDYLRASSSGSGRGSAPSAGRAPPMSAARFNRASKSTQSPRATLRFDELLRQVVDGESPPASGKKPSGQPPSSVVPADLLAYAKLTESQLKMDQQVDELLELFDHPSLGQPSVSAGHPTSSSSGPASHVAPVLKKAWPSISSVMKNLADSQQKSHQLGGGAGGLGGLAEELVLPGGLLAASSAAASGSPSSPWSGSSWDLRDESRADGPWKLKTDLLSDAFYEAVLQGLASSFHDHKRRPLPEDVPGDPIEPPKRSDHDLLSAAFNRILCTAGQRRASSAPVDVVATLKLWVLLNGGDIYGPSSLPSSSSSCSESEGASSNGNSRPADESASSSSPSLATTSSAIVLSGEAIRSCLEALARIPAMDSGDWATVLRTLALLASPRWLLTERLNQQQQPEELPDENAMEVEGMEDGGGSGSGCSPAELADQMCAGPVIGSAHLTSILFSLVSGQGLVPLSLADKQLVGPSIVTALSDVLSCLKVWCNASLAGSILGARLRDSLLGLLLDLAATPHGPIARCAGPLDAQLCLVESLLKLPIRDLDPVLAAKVVQSSVGLAQMLLARSGRGAGLACVGSADLPGQLGGQLGHEERVCFNGLCGPPFATSSANAVQAVAAAGRHPATPAALLSLVLQLAIRLISSCDGLADRLVAIPSVMDQLLDAVNRCTVSALGASLGVDALGDAEFSTSRLQTVADYALQLLVRLYVNAEDVRPLFRRLIDFIRPGSDESLTDLSEPLLVFALHALRTPEAVGAFHESGGFREVCSALARSPVRLFNSHSRLVSNVLSYVGQTAGGPGVALAGSGGAFGRPRINPHRGPFMAAAAAAAGLGYGYYGSPGLVSGSGAGGAGGSGGGSGGSAAAAAAAAANAANSLTAAQNYLDATSLMPLAVYRRGGLRLDDEDDSGLLNLAPLSTISCSHPSAQPADVLLQPNPPHRRARSPSWSHHFYPSEHFIELTVSLPCPVLVKEIQLHPHLTSLATCPSSVGVEMSPEASGHPQQLYPVGSVQSATGLTTISLKLDSARVAALILLRLYKPRDSSNIGLAQIRILGSLALPSSSVAAPPPAGEAAGLFGSSPLTPCASLAGQQSGLTWLTLMHHCLTVAEKDPGSKDLLDALRTTAGQQSMLVEQCCGLLNSCPSGPGMAGSDPVQMASDVLLDLGRHSPTLSERLVRLQLQEPSNGGGGTGRAGLLLGATPAVSNVLHELCVHEKDSLAGNPTASGQQLLLEWLHQTALWRTGSDLCSDGPDAPQAPVSTCLVHCASAVLWSSSSSSVGSQLDMDLAQSLFDWAKIVTTPELKVAVDYALCSVCLHRPDIYASLLANVLAGPSGAVGILQRRSLMETLARASQSEPALDQLVRSGLLSLVSRAVSEFCLSVLEKNWPSVTPALLDRVVTALDFWTLLCQEWGSGPGRDVLAAHLQGESLLQLLLQALCHHRPSEEEEEEEAGGSPSGKGSSRRFSRIEDSAVSFFRHYCWAHKENSRHFAEDLLRVLQPIGSSSAKLLTGFTRRLLLQLLLEPEKVYVYVTLGTAALDGGGGGSQLAQLSIGEPRHPSYRHGKKSRLIYVSSEVTVADLTRLLTEGAMLPGSSVSPSLPGLKMTPSSKRAAAASLLSSLLPSQGGGGSGAGLAQETPSPAADKRLTGRAGSILGQLYGTTKSLYYLTWLDESSGGRSSALPGSWTLSQLLSIRRDRQPRAKGALDLRLAYSPPLDLLDGGGSNSRAEALPSPPQPLTTLLDEFASLGGLAVLSKHLPMLLSTSAASLAALDQSGSSGSLALIRSPAQHHHGHATMASGGLGGTSSMSSHLNGVTADTLDSWVKLDGGSDELDEEMDEILMAPHSAVSTAAGGGTSGGGGGGFPPPTPQYMNTKRSRSGGQPGSGSSIHALPMHSLAAFSLFLGMPLYARAVLEDRRRAQMLLRLALGVAEDGLGGNILSCPDAATFPILPFVLLQQVLDAHPASGQAGAALRQEAVDMGVLDLLLACLAVFTQQVNSATVTIPTLNVQFLVGTPGPTQSGNGQGKSKADAATTMTDAGTAAPAKPQQHHQQSAGQQYWAKGTGFGTGSTAQTWDVDGAMHRQRAQEEQATCLLHTLAAYIHPSCPPASFAQPALLPPQLFDIVQSSHLVSAICSYLRNDSVMDMARHVPLYKALLLLLRSMAACPKLVPLLLPTSLSAGGNGSSSSAGQSIHSLLFKLKNYVSSYTARLASVQNRTVASGATAEESSGDSEEGIADLSKDICNTWAITKAVVEEHSGHHGSGGDEADGQDSRMADGSTASSSSSSSAGQPLISVADAALSLERLYCEVMQPLQFDSYELLVENPAGSGSAGGSRFTVAYHFESAVRSAGERSHPNRMKRLAQEAATLTTSLPLSSSSSVFVRCDTDRLDMMKVLITGPADTPYANGCFEFDVYFPPDYPQSPMQVHLATTGRHTVRFNPNLYNDGKVCLSVLNTWHGRPEEKWNPHTSSLLQVLVSIQSLILVPEPYFNEPGYERSRGTPSGNQNSRDYDVNIRQASVKWAMLEQIRSPSACFKEVTQAHFWLKRGEIQRQCEEWIAEMERQVLADPNGSRAVSVALAALKRHYGQLKDEMARLSPPACMASRQEDVGKDRKDPGQEAAKAMEVEEAAPEEVELKTTQPDEQFAVVYDEEEEEEEEEEEDDEDEEEAMKEEGGDEEAEEEEDELDELKEMIFANADSDLPVGWKEEDEEEDEEDEDSEAELDNFTSSSSQFTI